MASAAAVGADLARSPSENDLGEDDGRPGQITSGIYPKDDDDEDEDLPSNPLSKRGASRRVNGNIDDDEDEAAGEDDLFGDEDGDAGTEQEEPKYVPCDYTELAPGN